MKCWNCGTQNQKTAKICKKCGSELIKPEEKVVERNTANMKNKVKPFMWVLIAIAGLAIVLTLVFVLLKYTNSNHETDLEPSSIAAENFATETEAASSTNANVESDQTNPGSESSLTSTDTNNSYQGEGCDWATCAWMEKDQCVECEGTWMDYGDETYCDCSDNKWQMQELEWCKFEGGSWLEDEGRCTFLDGSNPNTQTELASACSDLTFSNRSGDESGYQVFKAECKAAGGVDQCWDQNCNLSVCLCPDEENVPISCDWVTGQKINSNIKCYDENGTCWLTIEPTDAFGNLSDGEGQPEVVVTTSDGQTFSSIDLNRSNSGCIYDKDQISCLISENSTFNTTLVEHAYMCMDLCCLDLDSLESGDIVVQSGNCPGSGNLEVWDFQVVKGVLSLQLRNSLGWDVDTLDVFLDDAKGDHWSTLDCQIDEKYDTIMNCEGWAVYKSGYATINFYYGSGGSACSVSNVKFYIPEMSKCNYDQTYCSYTDSCCRNSYTCCSCGCKKLDDDESCSDVCD